MRSSRVVRPRPYRRTAVSKIDSPLQGLKAVGLDRALGVRTDGDSSQRIRQLHRRRGRHFGPHLHRSPPRTRLFASYLRSLGKAGGIRV